MSDENGFSGKIHKLYFIQIPGESFNQTIDAHGGLEGGFIDIDAAIDEAQEVIEGDFLIVDELGKVVYKETKDDTWH